MLYVDTSALIKLYVSEPESKQAEQVLRQAFPMVFTSLLTYTETLSALWRARGEGRLTSATHSTATKEFLRDWQTLQIVEAAQSLLSPARKLIEKYSLRGADAVHLCSAVWVGASDFACFDSRLSTAADAEGMNVVS